MTIITTGLNVLYEGITIATIQKSPGMTPLVYGSAKNLVTALYDKNGRRALFDGGFTRLYCNWDSAGTGRYVKNAAAWLANYDQWGRYEHIAPERHAAGQTSLGKTSSKVFYYIGQAETLRIGGYWENDAEGKVTVYGPDEKVAKEATFTGNEHYFEMPVAAPGIWSADVTFTSGAKKAYTYVISAGQVKKTAKK
nr:hypothetical protein [Candidatus Sigynarchaeota archaeon]